MEVSAWSGERFSSGVFVGSGREWVAELKGSFCSRCLA